MQINRSHFTTSAFFNTEIIAPDYKSKKPARIGIDCHLIIMVILGLGILLRLFHYIDNRALYLDEAFLANSLIRMDYLELATQPLAYEQKAPVGFLWLVRLSVVLFGQSEMALRLFPLLCGLFSLFAFVPVARFFLKPLGVVVALGILALAPPIIYHATEAKQYSTEMLATILALWLFVRYQQKLEFKSLLVWGIAGAGLLWFSYSVIFILAGMAGGIGLYYLVTRNWPALLRSFIPFGLWLVSFAVNYFFFTYKHTTNSEWLVVFFRERGGFMPLPPTSFSDLWWFYRTIFSILHYPLGLTWFSLPGEYNAIVRLLMSMTLLPLGLLVAGLIRLYRQDKTLFMVLVFPILLALLASGLELYPSYERFTLYLAPLLILFIALGCEGINNLLFKKSNWRYLLPVLLLAGPIINSGWQVINPSLFGGAKRSYQRETLLYINDHYQPGDVVYADWTDLPAYNYYKYAYNLKFNAIKGRDVRFISSSTSDYFNNLAPDLQALIGHKRVWLIYSKYYVAKIGDTEGVPAWYYTGEEEFKLGDRLYSRFSAMGKEIDSYTTYDVKVGLFDFSGK